MKFKFTEHDIHVIRQLFTDEQYNNTINHIYVLQIKFEDIYKEIIKSKK